MTKIGILASISKNSTGWKGEPTEKDLTFSKFDFVKKNSKAHEALNFGYPECPAENDGTYIGYAPAFNKKVRESNIKVIFFISLFAVNDRRIVGFYALPEITQGCNFERTQSLSPLYKKYSNGNIRVKASNIVYLKNSVPINEKIANGKFFEGKLSSQGFNYLDEKGVVRLFDYILKYNGEKKIAYWKGVFSGNSQNFDEIEVYEDFDDAQNTSIEKLEKKFCNAKPKEKSVLSKRIERGQIANRVKQLTNYKCLICEKLGLNPHGFAKRNGTYYVETHHVCPVSKKEVGSLALPNLVTVCANHHRQLHYGDVKTKILATKFVFEIEGKKIEIDKIKVK